MLNRAEASTTNFLARISVMKESVGLIDSCPNFLLIFMLFMLWILILLFLSRKTMLMKIAWGTYLENLGVGLLQPVLGVISRWCETVRGLAFILQFTPGTGTLLGASPYHPFLPSLLLLSTGPQKAPNGGLGKDSPMWCEGLGGWRKERERDATLGSILFAGCILLK